MKTSVLLILLVVLLIVLVLGEIEHRSRLAAEAERTLSPKQTTGATTRGGIGTSGIYEQIGEGANGG
jgi:hypothetical protein